MLSDIFSSFDEQNGNLVGSFFIWGFGLFFFFIFVSFFWVGFSRLTSIVRLFQSYLLDQRARSIGDCIRGFSFFVGNFFFFTIFCNFLGLIPYVFRTTSHLVITFSVAVPLWIRLLLSSAKWKFSRFLSHFLPAGAPSFLNPFLVLVETTSVSVRPITLSVRLAANIGAGHIVIGLVGVYMVGAIFSSSVLSGSLLFFIQSFYFIFEFGICLVQGYIFSLLLVLYSDEHSYVWFYS